MNLISLMLWITCGFALSIGYTLLLGFVIEGDPKWPLRWIKKQILKVYDRRVPRAKIIK